MSAKLKPTGNARPLALLNAFLHQRPRLRPPQKKSTTPTSTTGGGSVNEEGARSGRLGTDEKVGLDNEVDAGSRAGTKGRSVPKTAEEAQKAYHRVLEVLGSNSVTKNADSGYGERVPGPSTLVTSSPAKAWLNARATREVIVTAHSLASHGLVVPLKSLVDEFLKRSWASESPPSTSTSSSSPIPPSATSNSLGRTLNLLLQALSSTPTRTPALSSQIVSILEYMSTRGLSIHPSTYTTLLREESVTEGLAGYLKSTHSGRALTKEETESWLKVYAKRADKGKGRESDAMGYHRLLHELAENEGEAWKANTILLSGMKDKATAFGFLESLSQSGADSSSRRMTASPTPTTYDYTATLHVLCNDPKIPTRSLIAFFLRIPNPTTASYTILLRGLIRRKEWIKGEIWWGRFLKAMKQNEGEGLKMDRQVLITGCRLLIRSGKPHSAFQLLETYADPSLQNPVTLSAISLNELMTASNRIARPDLSFLLFHYCQVLYGIQPTDRTLCILLQSARLAHRLDEKFLLANTLAQFRPMNPFRRRWGGVGEERKRESVVDLILSAVGHPSRGGLRRYRYRSGLPGEWEDRGSVEWVRGVVLRVLWGYDSTCAEVTSPAHPTRESYDSEPYFRPRPYAFSPPPDFPLLPAPPSSSFYPSVIPTNSSLLQYLLLLGSTGKHMPEIPLVLAWMRHLRIQPSSSTLAVGMVLWGEISGESMSGAAVRGVFGERDSGSHTVHTGPSSPAVDSVSSSSSQLDSDSGGGNRAHPLASSETARLIEWVEDWVGEGRMPTWRILRKWRGVVESMRNGFDGRQEESEAD